MVLVVEIVAGFLRVLAWLCIIDALLSWVQGPDQVPRKYTQIITEPLYAPIHAFARPVVGGMDLTPLIVMMALSALSRLLYGALG
jgi:uncharacterized protein YggT (Ycf19 family)